MTDTQTQEARIRDQLLAILLNRLGGFVELTAAEMDGPLRGTMIIEIDPTRGRYVLEMRTAH